MASVAHIFTWGLKRSSRSRTFANLLLVGWNRPQQEFAVLSVVWNSGRSSRHVSDSDAHLPRLNVLQQIFTCLVRWETACIDDITRTMRHHTNPCTSGYRGRKPAFTKQEYTLLFKGGRLLTNPLRVLENNYCCQQCPNEIKCNFYTPNLWIAQHKKQGALLSR